MRTSPFIESYRPAGKVIALLGSLRYAGAFHRANTALSLQGALVFAPPLVAPGGGVLDEGDRATLEAVTRQKIQRADEVLVLDCCHHVGHSTEAEVAWAGIVGKPVHRLSVVAPDLFQEVSRMPAAPRSASPDRAASPQGRPPGSAQRAREGVKGGFGGLPETLYLPAGGQGEGA